MIEKLNSRTAATTQPGDYGDGGGLRLIVSQKGNGKWVFRFSLQGKIRNMGLGSRDTMSLIEAREARDRARKIVASGNNPIEVRKNLQGPQIKIKTFGMVAEELISSKEKGWRNNKHRNQWVVSLREHCASISDKSVCDLTTADVMNVLRTRWSRTPETAYRLRGRIESVIDAARAYGYISQNAANPARWHGHLDKLLTRPQKLAREHHAALPYTEVPRFISRLQQNKSCVALALELTILCATRTNETLGSRWDEIDFSQRLWSIPKERMKAGRAHRIPLTSRALEILEYMAAHKKSDYIFPGIFPDHPLSNQSMRSLLNRMKIENATVHGFRSSFRDWCGNETDFSREIAESALAHVVSGIEGDYRRSDALEKRRQLMRAWGRYCNTFQNEFIASNAADERDLLHLKLDELNTL